MELETKFSMFKFSLSDEFVKIGVNVIPVPSITKIKYEEPTMLLNGFLFFCTASCPGDDVRDLQSAGKHGLNMVIVTKKKLPEMKQIMDFFEPKVPVVRAVSDFVEKEKEVKSEDPDAILCPKCHSKQIMYGNQKVSIGRAVVGGALFGAAGAVLGGVSGKKVEFKCLQCGHTWKK